MDSTLIGPLILGGSTAALAGLVYADLPALVAHLAIGAGAWLCFPTWTTRLAAFVGANVCGIALGLVGRFFKQRS